MRILPLTRRGMLSFYSYRDPNLDATLERFDQAGTWLANFAPTEEEMRGYVISTVADWTEFVKHHGLTPVLTEGEKALVVKP